MTTTDQTPPATAEAPAPLRWHRSVIVRVIVLCVVLVLCLLGTVVVMILSYTEAVVSEMEAQAEAIASSVMVRIEQNPDVPLETLAEDLTAELDTPVELEPATGGPATSIGLRRTADGGLSRVAEHTILIKGEPIRVTAWMDFVPHTEIVRAFSNRYMLALIAVFVAALAAMVYFITRMLRPLRDITRACKRISEGELEDVRVQRNYGEVLALEQTFNRMVASLREKEVVETNLRQAQRLSALGTLAAGVAHDIRNPLNAIKLLSSHAIDRLNRDGDAAPVARQVQTIRTEVDRLEDIVSRFLSLAKETELRLEEHTVDPLLLECIRLIKQDAEARDVRITTELRAGDTALRLDPKQFRRAVLNVLINALEATPAGGRVRVFSRATDSACEVEVRDDGPGMARDVAEHVFDPYYTTKPTGTGLGLSITRSIIEEHGGAVSLTSAEGQGTQVLIALPALRHEETPS